MIQRSFTVALVLLLALSAFGLAGCSSQGPDIALADLAVMPSAVRTAPERVAEAYRFAKANPDITGQIPCYCGCGAMGHASNYACFWQADGSLDEHALGCGICVDIAQDTIQGLRDGRSLADIRAQIDADYSRFGPPTNTPPVGAANSGVQTIDWSNLPASTVEATCNSNSSPTASSAQTAVSVCSSQSSSR